MNGKIEFELKPVSGVAAGGGGYRAILTTAKGESASKTRTCASITRTSAPKTRTAAPKTRRSAPETRTGARGV